MKDGLRINRIDYGKQSILKPDMNSGGVAFFEGRRAGAEDVEARMWIDNILNDTEPMVKPEQALVVTEILEAIYTSAKTGKQVDF